jgi:hypothetical protein
MLKSKGGDNGHPAHQAPPFKSEKYVALEISSAQIEYICLVQSNYGAQRRVPGTHEQLSMPELVGAIFESAD